MLIPKTKAKEFERFGFRNVRENMARMVVITFVSQEV